MCDICGLCRTEVCVRPPPRHPTLYSTKQTPRGSVVVLGDRIISEHEMPTAIAQQTADWLNNRKSA
jgi:hypothetical protein